MASVTSNGVVVKDYEVCDDYGGVKKCTVQAFEVARGTPSREMVLTVFESGEVAVSTLYVPIDVAKGRLFINMTYEGVLVFWRPRPQISEDHYTFKAAEAEVIARKTVIIGGPVDGNYYHWVLNWLSRLIILKMLRPDMLKDPNVSFLMDWRAQASPFIDFLQELGLDESRLIWADHARDYLLRDGVLVSFGNQHATSPAIVEALRESFAPLGRRVAASSIRRLWISRQQLGPNRRRVHNMDDVRPLLQAYGLEEVELEGRSVAEQIALFQNADVIVSVHGAGLTNIIFCPPHCRVLALDTVVHTRFNAAFIYEALAKACGLSYRALQVRRAPLPDGVERNVANMHNQDLIVSPSKLDGALRELIVPQAGGGKLAD